MKATRQLTLKIVCSAGPTSFWDMVVGVTDEGISYGGRSLSRPLRTDKAVENTGITLLMTTNKKREDSVSIMKRENQLASWIEKHRQCT
uniref:Uncharacterized protein n=1 Tax=Steinernema glaseri TaxID=37863 RepID=A0A1I8AJK2_9BILA